ncbi:Mg2+ and Co2+ transporter CorA, partial [Geosmithia morbida]
MVTRDDATAGEAATAVPAAPPSQTSPTSPTSPASSSAPAGASGVPRVQTSSSTSSTSSSARNNNNGRLRRRPTSSTSSPIKTRPRAATFRTVEDFDGLATNYQERPGWQPGSEPGFDPGLPDGGHASMPTLSVPCVITVVDFSSDRVETRHMGNDDFIRFLDEEPQPAGWVKCRWINVNGISWDVIQAVGACKGLHKLALEDVMNLRNRTKMDWYPHHAFVVMTLQKLVHLVDSSSDSSSDSDDDGGDDSDDDGHRRSSRSSRSSSAGTSVHSRKRFSYLREAFGDLLRSRQQARRHNQQDQEKDVAGRCTTHDDGNGNAADLGLRETGILRTLQRYHASGNEARTEFMERHSSLAPHKMAISAEQVSVFLTSDNTVVSFLETSAGDVERPILARLYTRGTVLRQSCDGSLLVQAIIDAIIDLAIPLMAVYNDIIGDLELDVLTAPSIHLSRSLYICTSEINKMLSFLGPIENLVNGLRDHRTSLDHDSAMALLADPAAGVIISPQTHTYLGDVLDHIIIITEGLRQSRMSSDNLISLIFNTISATQNESMKQLTIVTIIFLPLTFITGFFGQNFPEEGFPEIKNGIWYFWSCAIPTAFATILILMRDQLYATLVRLLQRKHIGTIRKNKKRAARKHKKKSKTTVQSDNSGPYNNV